MILIILNSRRLIHGLTFVLINFSYTVYFKNFSNALHDLVPIRDNDKKSCPFFE